MRDRPRARRIVLTCLVLAALVLAVLASVHAGTGLGRSASHFSALSLLVAFAAVVAGLVAGMQAWRTMLSALGAPLPLGVASRVFFLAQLGKYLPGSVWPVVAQVELARDRGVDRSRSAAATVVSLALVLLSAVAVAAATLPFVAGDAARRYWPVLLVLPVVAAVCWPPVLGRLLALALSVTRRPPLPTALDAPAVLRALGWSVVGWACFAVHVALLLSDLGVAAPRALALGAGAFALAWSAGFLVVVLPAGAGAREAVLTAVLVPFTGSAGALAVALASRLLLTAADVGLGAAALVSVRRAHTEKAAVDPSGGAEGADAAG